MYELIDGGYLKKMKRNSPKVYLALLRRSDFYFKDVWPGAERIADDTGLSVNAVKRGLDDLVEVGLITKQNRNDSKKGTLTNLYSFVKIIDFEGYPEMGTAPYSEMGTQPYPGMDKTPTHKRVPNNNDLTISTTTTTNMKIPVDVVALFKDAEVGEARWPELAQYPIDQIKQAAQYASKKGIQNRGGAMADYLVNNYKPSTKVRADMWEDQISRVKGQYSHLQSKVTGTAYPILPGSDKARISINTGKDTHIVSDEKELLKFIPVSLPSEECMNVVETNLGL